MTDVWTYTCPAYMCMLLFSLYFSISFHSLRLIHIEAFYLILLLLRRRLHMRNTISNFVIVGDAVAVAGVDAIVVIVVILSHRH